MDRYTIVAFIDPVFGEPEYNVVVAERGEWVKYSDVESLQARVRELEGAIHSAYIEGYCDAHEVVKEGTRKYAEEYWKHSESCKQLKGTP